MHLFLYCDQAVQCWKEANLWHKVEHRQRQSGSFSTIIFSILTSLDEASCAHFVAVS
jgi:2-keto-4-pentenoate hydratase/2-oxohepta-3-ene-1,7-dioic acid hydratase in catechol pathway